MTAFTVVREEWARSAPTARLRYCFQFSFGADRMKWADFDVVSAGPEPTQVERDAARDEAHRLVSRMIAKGQLA